MDEDLEDQLYEYEDDMVYDDEESDANLEQDLHGLIDSGLIDEQLQQTLLGARNDLTDNPPPSSSTFSFIFQDSQADLQFREMEIQRLEQHLIQLAKKDDSSSSAPSSNSNNINKDSNAALDTLNPTKHEDRNWNSIDDKQLFGDETLMDEKYYEALQQLGLHVVEDHLSDAPLSWNVEDNADVVGLLENGQEAENIEEYRNLMKKYIENMDSWAAVQSTSNLMFLKRMRLLQRIHLAISREKERLLIPPKPIDYTQPTPPAPAPPAPSTSSKSKKSSKSAEKQNTPPAQVLDKLINSKQSMNDIIKKFLSNSIIAKLPLCLTHESPENVEKFQTRLSQYMKGKSQPQYVDQRVQATVAMILLALSTGSVRWLLHAVRSLLDDYSVNAVKSASSEWIKYPIAGYLKRLDKFRKYTEISAIVPEAYLKSFRYYWNPKLSKQKSRLRSLGAPPGQGSTPEIIATDGTFMYIYSDRGLVKVGTGYNGRKVNGVSSDSVGTISGKIYDNIVGYRSKDKLVDIVCVRDKLCLTSSSIKSGCVLVLNAATLQEEGLVDFATARDTSDEIQQITKEHMITSTNNRIRITSDGTYLYTICETTCTIPLDPPPLPTPSSPQPTTSDPKSPTPPSTPPAPVTPPTTTVKKYWVDIFNIGSNTANQNNGPGLTATFLRRIELKLANPPPPSTSGKNLANQVGHESISCNACHRIAFRLKRYQCKVCSSYNLCSTCYSSGVFANNQSSIGHRPEHYMEAVEIPIPPPPPSPSKSSTPVTSPTAPFTYDAFNRSCFYTTGQQLGIILAPKVLPNKSEKYISRVFDLNASNIAEEGNFIYDVTTESYSVSNACCYDRLNNILWTLHQYNHTLSQWRNYGPAPSVDTTYSPESIMNNPKFALPKPGTSISLSSSGGNTNKTPVKLNPILPEVVAVNILGQLDMLHKKQTPLSENDDSSQMLNTFHRIHFGPEPSVDNINELLSLLEWGMHRYMENIQSASAVTQQFVTYLLVSCLRLLKASLHFAFQVPDPIFKQAIITSDTDIANRTFLIVSRLWESTAEDPETSPVHAELSDLLLGALDAFFPTPQKKADVLIHLLAGNGLVRDGISVRGAFIADGKIRKKFVECFMNFMLKTISVEYVITETSGPTHVPNKLLPVLIEESNRELYSYYQALVNSLSNPAQTITLLPTGSLALQQPNLALRLLCNFQKELFSNSPSESIVHLTLYFSKLVFDACIDLAKKTLQLHDSITKACSDSTSDAVFRTLESALEYSILGTVLPTHLVSLGLFLENVGPARDQPTYPLHFLPPLKDLLTHLDLLNKLFPSLAQSEIKYLQHVTPAYDTASKVAESPHPYTEYTNKEITVGVPGALCLYVYFDPKCETESESDYVQIWRRKNEPISKKFYGGAIADTKQDNPTTSTTHSKGTWPEKPLVIPGDSMVIYLHSEGQASRTHRWGFRIFVKGIMSTHPVNISWYFDLEKTAAVLAGKLVESLISGDFADASNKLREEEKSLCRYSFLQQGVEEPVPRDNPSDVVMQEASQQSESAMQVESASDTAEAFLQDLIEGKGAASALHTQLCAKLKPKILPVPKTVEQLVEITSRRVLAVLLKLSNSVHLAVSASSASVPSAILDIWTAVYATKVRRWLRLLVQQARSGTTAGENENVSSTATAENTTPEVSVESAYESICANVQSLCAFLMKLTPSRSSSPSSVVNEVLAFIESSPKVPVLNQIVASQSLRAQYRAMGFKLVTEFLNCISLGSVRQDILASVGQATRRNSQNNSDYQYHYLAGLETCSPSLKQAVCAAFDTLIKHTLVMLNQPTSDYRLQLLVLDCLNLIFKPRDCELLSRLEFTQLVHQLAIGKISLWNLSVENRKFISLTNPVVNTSLPPSEITPQNLIMSSASSSQLVEQLVGGCCEVGKTVGPVVPQRFSHHQVASKGLAKEQEFTISLWVYPVRAPASQATGAPLAPASTGTGTSTTSWRTIIFKGTDAPENQKTRSPALFYSVEDLSLALCVSTPSNWNVCLRSASEVPFDQWTHVACVLDNNVLAIYINGIRDSEMILGEPIVFNDHPFCIGTTPSAINEKLGFHGFVENVQYYYNTLTDSNLIKLIQKSTPLPPEFSQRHKYDIKKLKYLGSTLFNLLAINVLTWDVNSEEQDTQKRIQQFQNSIIEILVAELGEELTKIQKQMNAGPVHTSSTEPEKLYDDERCYALLLLIFKLRNAAPVYKYFSQPAVIIGLAERVLQENTPPRIQRLLMRLYRHILLHTNPAELDQSSQSFADFLLSKMGALYLVGSAPGAHPDSAEIPMTIDDTQSNSLPTSPRESSESYVVMLHSCPGITPDELSRALQKQITKEISSALQVASKATSTPIDPFSYIRGIALEAQEMGKAVLKTGTKDECVSIAVKLAKAGFVCTLLEVPNKNEHCDNRNLALSTSQANPRKIISGQIAYATSCEIVMLLRHLWKSNDSWASYWKEYCTSVLVGLNKLLQSKASELVSSAAQLQHLERTFGVLCMLGGLVEGFRVGSKVEVHSEPDPDSRMLTHAYLSSQTSIALTRPDEKTRRIASIIEYDRLGGVATIVYDSDNAKKSVIISVGYLRPIPEISLLGEHFPLTADILANFASFLKNAAKNTSPGTSQKSGSKQPAKPAEPPVLLPLEQDNPLVYSHLKTLALRAFVHLLQSKESIINYLALMQNGALPLLTDIAASFGQVRVDDLNLYEQKILKIIQKLHENQLNHLQSPGKLASALAAVPNSPPPSDTNNNNTTSPSKKPRYKDVIPYSPYCNNEELLLPTVLSHKGSEIHHAIPINERTVEFYGYDGDELVLVSDHPVPSAVPEFYFEIRLEMDSLESQMFAREKEKEKVEKEKQTQGFDFGAPPPAPAPPPANPAPAPASPAKIHCNFSIGMVPTTGLPVWANGAYGYHSTKGQKSSVVKKEAFRNLPRYKCPFCKIDGISERELCFHVSRRHANGVKRVVCPICATSPFGNPNYVSNDFRGHLSERHARKLPPDPCPPVHEKYGPTFNHGDIIGCGYNKEEGTIYFTLNGKYLGIAFINVEGAYYPMVALRTPNTRLTANFGQEPFAFDPNTKQNKALIRREEKEYKEKLKKDEEARIKKEQEEQAAILSNRLVQASVLQGFVGFPLKYCMHALLRNNENIELAAEWAMTNFEAYSIEHPELFENDDDFATAPSQPSQSQPSQNAPSNSQPQDQEPMMSTDNEEDMDELPFENLSYHLGYTYSLSQFDKEDSTGRTKARLKSSKVNLDQLQVGQQLFVNVVDYSVVGRTWVPLMEKTLSKTGVVKEVDNLYLEVLLQFFFDNECTSEEWWYPVRVLTTPTRYRRDAFPSIVTTELTQLIRLALDANDKLTQLYICKAATMFEELTNVFQLDRHQAIPQTVGAIVGGPSSLINLLQVVSREYMTQPLPDLSMNPCKLPFLEKLRMKLNALCTEAANNSKSNNTNPIVEMILQESLKMLKTASDFVTKFSIIEESEHPYVFTSEVSKKIHIDKSSSLFVTFEKKSRLAGADKIVFYADDEYSSMIAMATGVQFVPIMIPSDTVYIKYMPSKDVKSLDKSWGYRYSIAPSIPEFNMSMWLLQYLMSNASHYDIENIHVRIFKTLFTYLYNTSLPIAIKVIVLRMLTRILQVSGLLPDDIKSSDPRRMRDTLRAELEELLRNPQKSDLASPYLQSLAELMVETKFVMAPFTPFYENTDPMAVSTYNTGYPRDMGLFDKLCELKMMIKALQYRDGQNQMPFNAIVEAVKMTSLSENMDESSYVKVVSQSLNLGKLKDITVQLFNRFDTNKDGVLNEEEFNHFQLSSGQNPYSENEADNFGYLMNAFAAENSGVKGFTVQGLVAFHEKLFTNDRAALCRRLRALGVDSSLSVVSKELETKIDYVEVASQQSQWTLEMDEQLIQFINELTDRLGCDVLSLTPAILNSHNLSNENNSNNLTLSSIGNNPNSIWRLPLHAIKTRFAILKIFNEFAAQTLPLIDLSQINVYSQSFAHQLSTIRSLLFYDVKLSFLREALTKTAVGDKEPPTIYLDRLDALKQLESDVENSNCVFIQAMKQLHPLNTAILRQKERAFKVVFKGEHAEGEVGPYRESISQMCMELDNEAVLPLLIPCPNQQLAKESIGVGENREKFIINPATMFVDPNRGSGAKSNNIVDFGSMYEFFGKLIGVAIRSKNPLSLDLPSVFWKPLVGQKPTRQDLKEIDYSTIESLDSIEAMDENTFNERFAELQTFSTLLSDRKTTANLIPNGDQIQVTFQNRHDFVKLKVECLLNESRRQMECIMKGLRTVVPVDILKLFSWRDIRYLVCGNPDVDLELLKKHTRYRGGVKNTDSHIVWFWETLEEFSPAERSLFLRFAWGRERLPPEREFSEEMKIFPSTKTTNHDNQLPHADTCFFNVSLPSYSSKNLMKEKLLVAITHTMAMDGDTRSEQNDVGFGLRQFREQNMAFIEQYEEDDDY